MLSKKELYNAKNAGQKIEKGMVIEVVSVGQFDDTDKDGNAVKVTALKAKDGSVFTTISATISNSIDLLEDILADEGSVEVRVLENTSNGGRNFYQLEIL